MDKRRKITFYLNPETNEADRYVCQTIDDTPQGERGRLWRATLLTGFAFGKQDERLPYLFSELLNSNTTFDELLQLLRAVYPRDVDSILQSQGRGEELAPSPAKDVVDLSDEETRNNARSMFGGSNNG